MLKDHGLLPIFILLDNDKLKDKTMDSMIQKSLLFWHYDMYKIKAHIGERERENG